MSESLWPSRPLLAFPGLCAFLFKGDKGEIKEKFKLPSDYFISDASKITAEVKQRPSLRYAFSTNVSSSGS